MKVYEAMNILSKAEAGKKICVCVCLGHADLARGQKMDDDLYSVVLDVSEIELEDDPVILAGC